MAEYHPASICLNGHVMSNRHSNVQSYCSCCGEKVISTCPSCGAPIHGDERCDGIVVVGFDFKPDSYCYNCGNPYPWVQRIIDASKELLDLDDGANQESIKNLVVSSLPDLIVSSPKKEVAKAKFKKGLKSFSSFTKDSLQNILSDVLSEAIKKSLFES